VLKGLVSGDLTELSFELAAQMLVLGEVVGTINQARRRVREQGGKGSSVQETPGGGGGPGRRSSGPRRFSRLPTARRTET